MSDDASTVADSIARSASTLNSASGALESGGSSEALIGMAALGKTAAALALVIAIILVCTALLKRWGPRHTRQGTHLKVVGSTPVGNRERVVVVEVEGTWLVLGVGHGQISKLHELPAPPPQGDEPEPFAQRFAHAIKRQHDKRPDTDSARPDSPS